MQKFAIIGWFLSNIEWIFWLWLIPSPQGVWEPEWYHMTGKTLFSNMDVKQVEAIKAFSALRQEITRHLLIQADRLNCPATDWWVINLVIDHFYGLAPCTMQLIKQLVKEIEESCRWGQSDGFPDSSRTTGYPRRNCSLRRETTDLFRHFTLSSGGCDKFRSGDIAPHSLGPYQALAFVAMFYVST